MLEPAKDGVSATVSVSKRMSVYEISARWIANGVNGARGVCVALRVAKVRNAGIEIRLRLHRTAD